MKQSSSVLRAAWGYLARRLLSLVLIALGVLIGSVATFELKNSPKGAVNIYVDRTPALPQEADIRRAAETYLADQKAHRWQQLYDDVGSTCRQGVTPESLAAGWDNTDEHLELQALHVTEIHDNLALVDSQVLIVSPTQRSRYGPNHGTGSFFSSFKLEYGKWRVCLG